MFFAGRVEDQHAEADEGVAEEYGDGEEDHDEEDVDFLAEAAVSEGDCEVCYSELARALFRIERDV